jgi:predicted PhzF superfamily epimerase YddE/YHI9
VAAREEERMIGGRHAGECVARGIADRIGLGLDDPTTGSTAGSVAAAIANEHFADKKTRQFDRVFRQL